MPTPPPAAQAAAYLRVSTEEQTEFSPEAQLRALETYATAHGLTLDSRHSFRAAGLSGRRAETRPGFMAMIRAARSPQRPFDVILVHRFDRFARSREDSVVYKSMLRRECGHGINPDRSTECNHRCVPWCVGGEISWRYRIRARSHRKSAR